VFSDAGVLTATTSLDVEVAEYVVTARASLDGDYEGVVMMNQVISGILDFGKP